MRARGRQRGLGVGVEPLGQAEVADVAAGRRGRSGCSRASGRGGGPRGRARSGSPGRPGPAARAASSAGIGPSASRRASVVPSMYCIEEGLPLVLADLEDRHDVGWSSCEAASASTRNRATSCGEGRVAAEQPLQRHDPAAARLPGADRPRPSRPGPAPRAARSRRTGPGLGVTAGRASAGRSAGRGSAASPASSGLRRPLGAIAAASASATQIVGPQVASSSASSGCRRASSSTSGSSPRREAVGQPLDQVGPAATRRDPERGRRLDRIGAGRAGRFMAGSTSSAVSTGRSFAQDRRGAGAGRGGAACRRRPRSGPASGRPRRWRAARSGGAGGSRGRRRRAAARAAWNRRSSSPRKAAAAGVSAGSRSCAGQVERRPVGERAGAAAGQRPLAVEAPLPASRCRRCASIIWSRAICRSQRWNGIAGLRR